jgi:glycosyltransferase involved in cell wall biosynthesis
MKVGMDYIGALSHGGNSVYTYNLCKNIAQIEGADLYLFHYLHDYLRSKNFKIQGPRVTYLPAYFSSLGHVGLDAAADKCTAYSLSLFCKLMKVDVFHFTNPLNYTELPVKKTVVTFHDLAYLHNKNWTKESSGIRMEKRMDLIVRGAAKIIAVSDYTKNDLLRVTDMDPGRIEVVYEGASDEFYPDKDLGSIHKKYKIDGEYILYVGQLQERKNILNLITAYSGLPGDLTKICRLVLRGGFRDPDYERKINDTVSDLGLSDRVILIGAEVNTAELRKLYSNAKFFIYPPFFEGFGLPVVEAMKCGAPVITSETSSLPEVGGGGALYVNPYDRDSIREAMYRLYYDDGLRRELKERGVVQAKKFDWRNTAAQTFKIYKDALGV